MSGTPGSPSGSTRVPSATGASRPAEDGSSTVVAAVESAAERHVIRVRDDGPGIPPHLLPGVFDRFTRADASRSRSGPDAGGSGLGLTVVEAIATALGGRARVRSVPGHTEFTLELPPTAGPRTERQAWGLSEQR
ncbi:ATP-binding protein [Streptomyces luteogriseus]|uniref:ATP-binding protein n=1 Tax=Streptomyces luteogriseus TaxID=68233 RepID=UPI003789339C